MYAEDRVIGSTNCCRCILASPITHCTGLHCYENLPLLPSHLFPSLTSSPPLTPSPLSPLPLLSPLPSFLSLLSPLPLLLSPLPSFIFLPFPPFFPYCHILFPLLTFLSTPYGCSLRVAAADTDLPHVRIQFIFPASLFHFHVFPNRTHRPCYSSS